MREHRAKSGKLIYYASRHELETLPGYRGNDRKGRACCPIHAGTNPTALAIDWGTGWASCWSCGDAWAIRVEDHPETKPIQNHATKAYPKRDHSEHDLDVLWANLEVSIDTAAERFPGSPGETYLAGRGIPLDIVRSLRIGWGTAGTLAGRVIFPLCGPDGRATSATGRAADDRTKPKYKALPGGAGYRKALFNGGAIAQAQRTGHPLIVVEGPLDAAACVAAGLPLTVALCGAAYAHLEQFAGVRTVILALDADAAGNDGRRMLWLDLMARGIEVLPLPAAALDGAKDLGEYWQRFHTMPGQLAARVTGPHMQGAMDTPMHAGEPHARESTDDRAHVIEEGLIPSLAELQQRAEEHRRYLEMTPDDLPADLRAEAEALAGELATDLDELGRFWADLHERAHLLTAEDRRAADYALQLAVAALPDEPLDDVA